MGELLRLPSRLSPGAVTMEIFVVGLNYKTAPVDLREKVSVPAHKISEVLDALARNDIFEERLLLSTCNRTELYGVARDPAESVRRAKLFLAERAGVELSAIDDKLYVMRQPDSVAHLFSVAAGLDSMVLGETEIIGQVKDAYQAALNTRHTGKTLNNLFQRSLKVAKSVRTQTEIGVGRVSVASVAVDLAGKIFETLADVRVMVIGTGEMSTQVTKAMISRGACSRIVSSRHYERAEALALELGGQAVHYDDYEFKIPETDILITATECPTLLVWEKQVRAWMKARHQRPLFLVDIAVPRNIETTVEKLDNVYLYNIDDLRGIAEKNLGHRQSQLDECVRLIGDQTGHFMDWLSREFGASSMRSQA